MKHLFLSFSLFFLAVFSVFGASGSPDTLTITSKYIDPAMKVLVFKPASYDDAASAPRRYPVVYLLHGYSGNYTDWSTLTQPRLDSLATHWNMILVCPDGRDSWYFDSKLNPKMQMESFFTNDLVRTVDAAYRTIPDARHRAITGLSMGGHGALWLAIRHSDIWGNAGSTSGGVDFTPWPGSWRINEALGPYESNKELWEHSTVTSLVPTLKPGQLNIIFDCGVDDFFHKVNSNLHDKLVAAGIPHDYISRPGAHTHPYWRNALLYQLQYFNECFNR